MKSYVHTLLAASTILACAGFALPVAAQETAAPAAVTESAVAGQKVTDKAAKAAADKAARAELDRLRGVFRTPETVTPADLAALDALSAAGNAGAIQLLGDSFRRGLGRPADPQRAKAAYDRVLALPKPPRSVFLAYGRLLDMPDTPLHDPKAAFALYQQGFERGDENAGFAYARALLDGRGTEANPEAGIAVLNGLAENDNALAIRDLASRYEKGLGVAADPDKAAKYLAMVSGSDEAKAALRLGALELDRENGPAALAAFEKARALGEASADRRIALLYLNGAPDLDPQPEKAREMIAALAQGGDAAMGHVLVEGDLRGDFGAASQPEAAQVAVKEAFAKGDVGMLARLAGQVRRPEVAQVFDVAQATAIFSAALEGGDKQAAAALVRLIRDVPDAVPGRAALMERIKGLSDQSLAGTARYVDLPVITAKTARGRDEFAELAKTAAQTPPKMRRALLLGLRSANPNSYAYVMQEYLGEMGYDVPKANGLLDTRTIRAIAKFCADKGIAQKCARGPLSQDAVDAIGTAMAQ